MTFRNNGECLSQRAVWHIDFDYCPAAIAQARLQQLGTYKSMTRPDESPASGLVNMLSGWKMTCRPFICLREYLCSVASTMSGSGVRILVVIIRGASMTVSSCVAGSKTCSFFEFISTKYSFCMRSSHIGLSPSWQWQSYRSSAELVAIVCLHQGALVRRQRLYLQLSPRQGIFSKQSSSLAQVKTRDDSTQAGVLPAAQEADARETPPRGVKTDQARLSFRKHCIMKPAADKKRSVLMYKRFFLQQKFATRHVTFSSNILPPGVLVTWLKRNQGSRD